MIAATYSKRLHGGSVMNNTFYSSCPEVRRTRETFVQYANIGGTRQRCEFEREIVWLRESRAQLKLIHCEKEVADVGTMTDYYGYLTAIRPEGLALETILERYSITRNTDLVLIVVATIAETPVVETPEIATANRNKPADRKSQWANVPDDWRKEAVIDGEKVWPRLEEIVRATDVVWSSKNYASENGKALESFCSNWSLPTVATAVAVDTRSVETLSSE